jgi:integrase
MYTSDALNWRFSKMTRRAGIGHWHAHEGRHTAVSIMSSNGVPLQDISDTVGHKSTHVTETVYRHVIVPAIAAGRRSWTRSSASRRRRRPAGHDQRAVVTWLVT